MVCWLGARLARAGRRHHRLRRWMPELGAASLGDRVGVYTACLVSDGRTALASWSASSMLAKWLPTEALAAVSAALPRPLSVPPEQDEVGVELGGRDLAEVGNTLVAHQPPEGRPGEQQKVPPRPVLSP